MYHSHNAYSTFGLLCTTKLSNPLKVVIVDDSDQTAPSWTLSNLHKQASSCGSDKEKQFIRMEYWFQEYFVDCTWRCTEREGPLEHAQEKVMAVK